MYVNDKRTPGLKARSKALREAAALAESKKAADNRLAMRKVGGAG